MKILAIHNAKGGVGSTLLAAYTCILSAREGVRVTAASIESNRELRFWSARHGIPWVDATERLPDDRDLLVLDVHSHTHLTDVLRPTLWVVPMDNRTAYENAVRAAPKLHGAALWVWNNVLSIKEEEEGPAGEAPVWADRPIPEHLRDRATFADQLIRHDPAIIVAAERFELACPDCSASARQIEKFVRGVLTRLGLAVDTVYPKWCGADPSDETQDEVSAYVRTHLARSHMARERLQDFFSAR